MKKPTVFEVKDFVKVSYEKAKHVGQVSQVIEAWQKEANYLTDIKGVLKEWQQGKAYLLVKKTNWGGNLDEIEC